MLLEREGHTGGAHASTQSRGVQAKHTILTGLNVLGVLLSMRVPVLTASVPAANELARALPDVCLSYTQKNGVGCGCGCCCRLTASDCSSSPIYSPYFFLPKSFIL